MTGDAYLGPLGNQSLDRGREPPVIVAGYKTEQVEATRLRMTCERCSDASWLFARGLSFARYAAPAVARAHDRRHHGGRK